MNAPPYAFIQVNNDPVFANDQASEDFRCHNCGGILIKGFFPECFVSVSIECFRCKNISTTDGPVEGEVYSIDTRLYDGEARMGIYSTLKYKSGITMTCDPQFQEKIQKHFPRHVSDPISFTPQALEDIKNKYERLGRSSVCQEIDRIKRYQDIYKAQQDYPFSWSYHFLSPIVRSNNPNLSDKLTNTAIGNLAIFNHVYETWSHHPRYNVIAREYKNPKSFHHTNYLLATAWIFFRMGYSIGFNITDTLGESKPDLYMRGGVMNKVYYEVKAPLAFSWHPEKSLDPDQIDDWIKNGLKRSNQINSAAPGLIALYLDDPSQHAKTLVNARVKDFLDRKGKDRLGLLGILIMQRSAALFRADQKIATSIKFHGITNPHAPNSQFFNFSSDGVKPDLSRPANHSLKTISDFVKQRSQGK